MVPTFGLPPGTLLTDQITPGGGPDILAENCSVSPARIWALAGVTTSKGDCLDDFVEDCAEDELSSLLVAALAAPQPYTNKEKADRSTRQFLADCHGGFGIVVIAPFPFGSFRVIVDIRSIERVRARWQVSEVQRSRFQRFSGAACFRRRPTWQTFSTMPIWHSVL